ncbi:hypothetical protein EEPDABAO_00035 [Klebsiella phage mfs]|uniref:Uncharacterized protein n=1 Tax=Klebsiella phage mfs TaxID=2985561 RepID=A0A9X9JUB8_9CAUD|nr:hypothetical protein EEPDABAO_00035 [Klebsiella phage mfs]
MKSREYLNTLNGLIYWLEDDAVMMRKREGTDCECGRIMTAAIFFAMVGNDTLICWLRRSQSKRA